MTTSCLNGSLFKIAIVQSVALVAVYYFFSIGLTFYQQWFIKDFHFPLTVVICHLVVKFILSVIIRTFYEICTKKKRLTLSWSVYIKRVSIVGMTSAIDIGFSNWSFEFITISLYTMTKSSCIIFILGFALLFGLEKIKWSLILVVILISIGLFLFTYQSTQFNLNGFVLVLSATISSGLRWTLAQLIMQKKELGLSNPVDMVYHIQPWMILGLLPLAVAFEGLPLVTSAKVFRFEDINVPLTTVALIFIGSSLAFLMEVSEFFLLYFTSSLTLSIAGILKEMFTIYLAWQYKGDSISTINFIGLVISLLGISLHVGLKTYNAKVTGTAPTQGLEMPLLSKEIVLDDEEDSVFEVQEMLKTQDRSSHCNE